MNCKSCSAPLVPHKSTCVYCGTYNDIDLRDKYNISVEGTVSDRICPDCNIKMPVISIGDELNTHIEQCEKCGGLFFDPGELERVLRDVHNTTDGIDFKRISSIIEDYPMDTKIVYRKCPICRDIMNRRNFAARSGVIVDICSDHGIWLDAGELHKLIQWKKAGGMLLDEQREADKRKREERERKIKMAEYQKSLAEDGGSSFISYSDKGFDIISLLSRFIRRYF